MGYFDSADDPGVGVESLTTWRDEPCPNCGLHTIQHEGNAPAGPFVRRAGCKLTISDLVAWFEDEERNREETPP